MQITDAVPNDYNDIALFFNKIFNNVGDKIYRHTISFYNALIAKINDNIVAVLVYGILDHINKPGIVLLGVSEQYRRQQYASKLVKYYTDNYTNSEVYLFCRENNKNAICLYEKLNWKKYDIINNYYWGPDDNAIVYIYDTTS